MSGYEFALCRVVLALNFFGVFIGSLVGVVLNQEPQLEAIELWKSLGVSSKVHGFGCLYSLDESKEKLIQIRTDCASLHVVGLSSLTPFVAN